MWKGVLAIVLLTSLVSVSLAQNSLRKGAFNIRSTASGGKWSYLLVDENGEVILQLNNLGSKSATNQVIDTVRTASRTRTNFSWSANGAGSLTLVLKLNGEVLGLNDRILDTQEAAATRSYIQYLAPRAKIYTVGEGSEGGGGGGSAGTIVGIMIGLVVLAGGVGAAVWYLKVWRPKAKYEKDTVILNMVEKKKAAISSYTIDKAYNVDPGYFEQKWGEAGASEIVTQPIGCAVGEIEDRLGRVSIKRMASGTVDDTYKGYFYAFEETTQSILMAEVLVNADTATSNITVKAETLSVLEYGQGLVLDALEIEVVKKKKKGAANV